MPQNAYLAEVIPQMRKHIETGKEEPIGYTFVYRQKINGTDTSGTAGDSIQVSIDNNGVSLFFRLWRQAISEIPGSEKYPITPQEAIEKAKVYLPRIFKGLDAQIKSTSNNNLNNQKVSGNLNREIPIQSAQLVYWSQPFTVVQETLTPAWKVSLENGKSIYIDATNGELLDHRLMLN